MAMMTALLAPMLIGLGGGAIDLSTYMANKTDLQDVADSAALSAAKEASLNGWSTNSAISVVNGVLEAHKRSGAEGTLTADVVVTPALKQVQVTLSQDQKPYFVIGYFTGSPQITAASTARTNNVSNVCVIGLEASGTATVSLETNAVVSAPKCAVYSNSTSTTGLISTGNANLIAQLACSAGGFSGASKNFNYRNPLTDCPTVTDPLASRPPPPVSGCKETDADYQHFIGSLNPGVYCGGLTIRSSSKVTLRPGVYVIKDGPLIVQSNSDIEAKGVGFFFTGENATLSFESGSSVNIEAPTTGPLAGITLYQDREADEGDFVITSNDARTLLGTIYLPNGNLIIDANNKVADASAYTAIVVRRLRLSKGPNLVLNTNYNSTPVPVPEGVGPHANTARLVH
jgi:Flp pilus assembly protein TadG